MVTRLSDAFSRCEVNERRVLMVIISTTTFQLLIVSQTRITGVSYLSPSRRLSYVKIYYILNQRKLNSDSSTFYIFVNCERERLP